MLVVIMMRTVTTAEGYYHSQIIDMVLALKEFIHKKLTCFTTRIQLSSFKQILLNTFRSREHEFL